MQPSPRLQLQSPHLQPPRKPRRPPENSALSHQGQDAVDQQGHDGGAEQAGHGHGDEPRQEDVPEEAPVHRFLGADPAHGHDRAHLEAAARGGGDKDNISCSMETAGSIWSGGELQAVLQRCLHLVWVTFARRRKSAPSLQLSGSPHDGR